MAIRTQVKTTIASGAALSGEVDLRGLRLVAVRFPSAWTAADLSVQSAPEVGGVAGTYGEVFLDPGTGTGAALSIDAAASQHTVLTGQHSIGDCFVKIRSGPSGVPVNQAADRILTLYVESV